MGKKEFMEKVPQEFSNDDFYDLCVAFTDVSLNSKKIKNEDGSLSGYFYHNDIDLATTKLKNYISSRNTDIITLKRVIRVYSHYVIEEDDKRIKLFFDTESTKHSNVSGILYDFTTIPEKIMDDIFDTALK